MKREKQILRLPAKDDRSWESWVRENCRTFFLIHLHICKCTYSEFVNEIFQPACGPHEHKESYLAKLPIDEQSVERCARIFRALGDPARLRLIARLAQAAFCVGELATVEQETVATNSQRLRVLRSDNIVRRKRDGKHVLYSLADQHMFDLVAKGLAHASEATSHLATNPEASSAPVQL